MNRKIIGILILIPVLLQSLSFTVIYSSYLLNKAYISTALCENRSIPEKHCEGKCVLKKEINAKNERENTPATASKKGIDVINYFTSSCPFLYILIGTDFCYMVESENYSYTAVSGIFHPPLV